MAEDKKDEARVFKLWHCPFCSKNFNHWVTPDEEKDKLILCPHCFSDVPIAKKKMM
jgi:hypothetical protein